MKIFPAFRLGAISVSSGIYCRKCTVAFEILFFLSSKFFLLLFVTWLICYRDSLHMVMIQKILLKAKLCHHESAPWNDRCGRIIRDHTFSTENSSLPVLCLLRVFCTSSVCATAVLAQRPVFYKLLFDEVRNAERQNVIKRWLAYFWMCGLSWEGELWDLSPLRSLCLSGHLISWRRVSSFFSRAPSVYLVKDLLVM